MLSFLLAGYMAKPRENHYDPDDMKSKIRHVIVRGQANYVNYLYLTLFRGLSTIILQQPQDSAVCTSCESSQIVLWNELRVFWQDRWGEAVSILDT
jgi:hypothetical protein